MLESKLFIAHQAGDVGGHIHRRAIERGVERKIYFVGQWRGGNLDVKRPHGNWSNSILNKLRGTNVQRTLGSEIHQIKLSVLTNRRNIKTLQRNRNWQRLHGDDIEWLQQLWRKLRGELRGLALHRAGVHIDRGGTLQLNLRACQRQIKSSGAVGCGLQ